MVGLESGFLVLLGFQILFAKSVHNFFFKEGLNSKVLSKFSKEVFPRGFIENS